MAALMKICPKDFLRLIEFSWGTMEEKYSKMKEQVMTWAVNKAEDTGVPVSMEVDWLEEQGREDVESAGGVAGCVTTETI